ERPATNGPTWRASSPVAGRSILITRAPRSASSSVQKGPASTRVRSTTTSPASGPVRAGRCMRPSEMTRRRPFHSLIAVASAMQSEAPSASRRIPALVVSGFLGSGKTTLVRALLARAQAEGERLAVVVNDFGALGIDRALLGASDARTVELAGG